MELRDIFNILTVNKKVVLKYGTVLEVYAARGTKTTIGLDELASLDTLSDELAAINGLLATAAELNRAADVSTRIVTLIATTPITVADHEGKILLMGASGGALTFTLPAATGSGARFKFMVSVTNTSTYLIKVANGSDVMQGSIIGTQDSGDTVVGWETGATADTVDLNAGTRGGVNKGDWVELIDIATNLWSVTGILVQTGTEATPFAATVS